MKKTSILMLLIVLALVAMMIDPALAQLNPGPPQPPVAGPEVGRYVATPIGGGIAVLISMLGYGIYRLRRKDAE